MRVPGGFATTAEAYRAFLAHNGLSERISEALNNWMLKTLPSWRAWVKKSVNGFWILRSLEQLDAEIETAWNKMVADAGGADISVAVRFFCNSRRPAGRFFRRSTRNLLEHQRLGNVKEAMRHVFASLYNDRAILTVSTKASNTTSLPFPQAYNAWCAPTAARPV